MIAPRLPSEFLRYLVGNGYQPGDRLPPLNELSKEIGVSIGKLREQLDVARALGLVKASPRRGVTFTGYSFHPPTQLSLMVALAMDPQQFDNFSSMRNHLEAAYWSEATALLTDQDKEHLRTLVVKAKRKLNQPRIRIPFQEHRAFHLTIFSRLNNPFVTGILEAYWDAYEAVELNTYADYAYLQEVWDYHDRIAQAIARGDGEKGRRLLIEHFRLLQKRGVQIEA
jgi:DNA-binding FadR family transcriptional regulator